MQSGLDLHSLITADRVVQAGLVLDCLAVGQAGEISAREKRPVEPFVVDYGPHLYRLEVGKTGWLFWRRDATRKEPPPSQNQADEQREKLQRMHNDLIFQP